MVEDTLAYTKRIYTKYTAQNEDYLIHNKYCCDFGHLQFVRMAGVVSIYNKKLLVPFTCFSLKKSRWPSSVAISREGCLFNL